MKKTILQMAATVLALWGIFTANSMVAGQQVMASASADAGVQVPVLMYHSILKDPARTGKYVLPPDALKADIAYLKEHGYESVTVSDLLAYVRDGAPLPEKPVMITFDDGYYNNYLYAYPILKEQGMRAVISIIGSQTALFTENGQENAYWSHLTTERCREMAADGTVEIQNHSYDLHTYGNRRGCLRTRGEDEASYRAFLQHDTREAQELITGAGLPEPTCYTYPFGSLSKESEVILKEMGFQCTLGCEEGVNTVTRDPDCLYQMKRFNRPAGISTGAFMKKAGIT
ncbi:polysaccharide deacetylase family protein [Intestinibacillus massiliensis]|nr:polysaccharide deacetylase family protein [Intestinibacillus massiliensis]